MFSQCQQVFWSHHKNELGAHLILVAQKIHIGCNLYFKKRRKSSLCFWKASVSEVKKKILTTKWEAVSSSLPPKPFIAWTFSFSFSSSSFNALPPRRPFYYACQVPLSCQTLSHSNSSSAFFKHIVFANKKKSILVHRTKMFPACRLEGPSESWGLFFLFL